MKKNIYLLLFALCCILFSCQKENNTKPETFFLKGIKDGKEWTATPFSGNVTGDDHIIMEAHGAADDYILFNFKTKGTGRVDLGSGTGFFTQDTIGDYTNSFVADPAATNYISITTLDKATGIATGTFETHYIHSPDAVDTHINFIKGTFRVQLPTAALD